MTSRDSAEHDAATRLADPTDRPAADPDPALVELSGSCRRDAFRPAAAHSSASALRDDVGHLPGGVA